MLDRRQFVGLSVGALIIAGVPLSLIRLDNNEVQFSFGEKALFGRIATDYFQAFPSEKDRAFLRASIPSRTMDVRATISEEFSRNDVVTAARWHLSRTEARIIGLIALTEGYL